MRRSWLAESILVPVLSMVCACTWTRFDDVTDNPPVEKLVTPNNASGIGVSMTTFSAADGIDLAVTSQDELVIYNLGSGAAPSRNAAAVQPCNGDASCVLAKQLAGLGHSALLENFGCVAYGVGTSTDDTGAAIGNIWLFCEDMQRRSLPVSDSLAAWLSGHTITNKTLVNMSTTRRSDVRPLVPDASTRPADATPLVVAVPDASVILYYDGVEPVPVELPTLPYGQVAGRAVAVIGEPTGYLIAASSIDPDNNVWLYRVKDDRTTALVGCIQGPAEFGRLMATGNFDDDEVDDLAVADEQSVTIIKGSSLSSIADSANITCTSLDATQIIGPVQCSRWSVLDGCAAEPFAESLASGNLDGVGPDELIVGVPGTSVRGESAAGAVFIHSTASGSVRTVQGLYVSTASSGDLLGNSIAIAHVSDIDTVIAGAPGISSVMAFYCNSLMPAQSKSARCP